MGRIRYQFDEHLANTAVIALRSDGIDVVTAAEAGLLGAADSQVLARAHESSRVVVTRDQDYLRLNAAGQPHSGIVFIGRGIRSNGDLIEILLTVQEVFSAADMFGHVEFV